MSIAEQVREYMGDPNTRVSVKHNDELGYWTCAVEVDGSRGFWLDAFESEELANQFIETNRLVMR